jgi:tetratricopeptide (TPR) repeat protein
MKELRPWLSLGAVGLVIGIGLSLVLTCPLLASRTINRPAALYATAEVATRFARLALPTRIPTIPVAAGKSPVPFATRAVDDWLDQADQFLSKGQAQKVLDLLVPKLEQTQDPKDLALLYYYLGDAECELGHYQLGAAYFGKRQSLEPTAENLMMLALAYDMGGDLERALKSYTELTEWSSNDASDYREVAEQRRKELLRVLSTPTPKR